jgi:hypothetical protein
MPSDAEVATIRRMAAARSMLWAPNALSGNKSFILLPFGSATIREIRLNLLLRCE